MKYIWDLIFVGAGFFMILIQIPFKFYMTKEFLFVLYDELKNKGLSSKIEDLREYSTCEGQQMHYSKLQVKKLRDDLYQIVRMPFLKFTKREYITLTSCTYVATVGLMIVVNGILPIGEDEVKLTRWHWEVLTLTCAIQIFKWQKWFNEYSILMIEPIITFVIPGYYYYKMSKKEDLNNPIARFGALSFAFLGVLISVFYTGTSVFRMTNMDIWIFIN